ncbi:ionotropic receptor 75a-like [Armigeres subalbatus]|uniref:ionotropic receptor 75a-like n=1 Tax=Armigeres subalbatus TaxID=124917 RepID=UPI002ED1F81E
MQQLTRVANAFRRNNSVSKTSAMALHDVVKTFDNVRHDGLVFKLQRYNLLSYMVKIINNVGKDIPRQYSRAPAVQHFTYDMPEPPEGGILSLLADNTFIVYNDRVIRALVALVPHHLEDLYQRGEDSVNIFPNSKSPKHVPSGECKNILNDTTMEWANEADYLDLIIDSRIQYVIVDEWHFEVAGKNSSKGVFGQLQSNLVEFSASPLALPNKERLVAYDVTVPFVTLKVLTIFRHPKNTQTRNIFLLPFRSTVWEALLTILVLTSMVLMASIHGKLHIMLLVKGQCILPVLGFLCQQTYKSNMSNYSFRIAMFGVTVFSFFIYQFYSSFIIGYLLVLPPKNIRSIEHLLASSLEYSIEDQSYNRDFFNRTRNPTALELLKQTFNDHQICELQEILLFPFRPLYIPVPKKSPLKEVFRVTLRRILETGLAQRLKNRFTPGKPPCVKKVFSFVQVEFSDVVSLYIFLGVAGAIALFVFIVEVVSFHTRRYLEMQNFKRRYPVWLD